MKDIIQHLFPDSVITVTSDSVGRELSGLLPEEHAQIQRAIARRQQEYAAGRQCARAALRRLGIQGYALVNDADRVPMWPPHIVGSVTHCNDFCGVAVTRRYPILGIGVDVEPIEHVDPTVVSLVCRERELDVLESVDAARRDVLFKAFFSAKESFYKAVFPLFRAPLEFRDVEIELDEDGRFQPTVMVHLPSGYERLTATGRVFHTAQHVFTGVTLTDLHLTRSEGLRRDRF